MSTIDVFFCVVYVVSGLAVGRYFALSFGPVFGIPGFFVGIGFGMIVWRLVVRLFLRRKR